MAGNFDSSVSFIEVPLVTAGNANAITTASAAQTLTTSAFTLPFDVEIVGISARGTGGAAATNGAGVLAINLYNGSTSDETTLMWSTTGTANSRTVSSIRIDQGVVTVTASGAHGYVAGQEVTISGVTADTAGVLTANILAGINGAQTVTSVPSTTTFTFGPLKQAALYDGTTGFWKFTVPSVAPAAGNCLLTEQLLVSWTAANSLAIGDTAGAPDRTVQNGYYGDQVTPKYQSRGFVPAGNVVTPWVKLLTTAYADNSAALTSTQQPSQVVLQIAVRKA